MASQKSDTVVISSKLPFPLIMELQAPFEVQQEVFGGGVRTEIRHAKVPGKRVTINGCSVHRDQPHDKTIVGGAALTFNVDAGFAKKWFEQNQGNPIVIKGLVEAHVSATAAKGEMRDKRAELSGFEPVNPNKFPEEFRALEPETKVEVEDDD